MAPFIRILRSGNTVLKVWCDKCCQNEQHACWCVLRRDVIESFMHWRSLAVSTVLVRVNRNQLSRKGLISASMPQPVCHEGKSRQELEALTEAEAMVECCLLAVPRGLLNLLFNVSHDPLPRGGRIHSEVGAPMPSISKWNALQTSSRAILQRHFL